MGDNTSIGWADASWNVITGCSVLSPGCEHCYAMRQAAGFLSHLPNYQDLTNRHGKWNGKVRFNEHLLDQPLRWRRPRRIFVNSMGDLFHENVSDEWIDRVFAVMAHEQAQHHQFLVLTKRAARMKEYLANTVVESDGRRLHCYTSTANPQPFYAASAWPLPNVWLGVSAEDQERADERIPLLLECPAAVRFVSAEPLLGPIDLTALPVPTHYEHGEPGEWVTANRSRRWNALSGFTYLPRIPGTEITTQRLGWVIVGGESGPGARPMNLQWVRWLVSQCYKASVPVFVKQLGANPVAHLWLKGERNGGNIWERQDPPTRVALKHRKGTDPNEWPEDLRVQEWPA